MAHLLTDEEILAGMARGAEEMARDHADFVNQGIFDKRVYRNLMIINGRLDILTGVDLGQDEIDDNISMVNLQGSLQGESARELGLNELQISTVEGSADEKPVPLAQPKT